MDIGKVVEIGDRKTPTPPLPRARARTTMTPSNASAAPSPKEAPTPAPSLASNWPARPYRLEADGQPPPQVRDRSGWTSDSLD